MPRDEFDALGVPATFDLDRDAIDRAYFRLAASLHPDMITAGDDVARQMAEINRARAVLESPERRADALLRRFGGPPAEREKALPPGFLARMMSVREKIELALGDVDAGRRRAGFEVWERWSREQRARAIAEVAALFGSLPLDPETRAQVLRTIRIELNAWRYIERLIEQLDPVRSGGPVQG